MKNKIEQTKKLTLMLGMGGLTGTIAIAALTGLFKLSNVPAITFGFMAGPGAIITSILLDGNMKERMFVALLAGIMATLIVILAAGFGPKLLGFLNINILKIAGGLSIFAIALLVSGIKINGNIPIAIIIIGLIASLIWR